MASAGLVSVIIPTRNRADLLPRAAASVLAQTYADLELIVIDDASTDDTPQVVAALTATDGRVRCIRNAQSMQNAARNVGLEAARGEVVAFLDDDDYWVPEKLERQLPWLDAYSLVGCLGAFNLPKHRVRTDQAAAVVEQDLKDIFWDNKGFSPSRLICKREHLQAIGGFDPELPGATGIDVTANVLARYGPGCYLAESLVVHFTDHGLPRISGSARWLTGCERELDKNRTLRTDAQLRFRRAQIELMRMRLAPSLGQRLGRVLKAVGEFDAKNARRHLALYRGVLASVVLGR